MFQNPHGMSQDDLPVASRSGRVAHRLCHMRPRAVALEHRQTHNTLRPSAKLLHRSIARSSWASSRPLLIMNTSQQNPRCFLRPALLAARSGSLPMASVARWAFLESEIAVDSFKVLWASTLTSRQSEAWAATAESRGAKSAKQRSRFRVGPVRRRPRRYSR
jgi:hypothetical protein